ITRLDTAFNGQIYLNNLQHARCQIVALGDFTAFRLDKTGRNKMFVAFILMIEAVLFYILYAQMPTSLNFFAINNVHHEILGFTINPVSFQALNPFWVVVASPVLAAIYTHL
ncbi:hypothetical protein JTM28_35600, partial [Pseudomonas aeruginosa]|nr:hypothetical protein [Pseudomonas aeruginosa]